MNTAFIGSTETILKGMFGHIPVDQGASHVYAYRRWLRAKRDDAAMNDLMEWIKGGMK